MEMLALGFDVHHLDGSHDNNDPKNLVLIDGADHMMLHNGSARFSRVVGKNRGGGRKKKARPEMVVKATAPRPVVDEMAEVVRKIDKEFGVDWRSIDVAYREAVVEK